MNAGAVWFAGRGPWAIQPAAALELATRFTYELPASGLGAVDRNGSSLPSMRLADNVAIIEVRGILLQNPSPIEIFNSALGYGQVASWIDTAVASGVRGIVLVISSPGGSVTGCIELANKIRTVSQRTPTLAVTDCTMASAAYWIGCSCRQVLATPSSVVGSIGVVLQITDATKLASMLGLAIETFASGRLKTAGNPLVPLTDEHRGHFQQTVAARGDEFRAFVSQQRPGVADEIMQGQCFSGSEAMRAGLVDGLLSGGISEAVGILTGKPGAGARITVARSHSAEFDSPESEAAYNAAVAAGATVIGGRVRGYTMEDFKAGKLN